ncbi:hypothetical protein GLX30_00010 [Streptomyces sp. Tu 2975]|uniref:hypothetical protein n=1 Tax=Streptomyces sp. Tu 2975 TaxID=2676871 RepID=UPI001356CD3C|nr:hypothetical protein [Streptomyces sp. Tu 2975]QIP82715.1 hypothetical protein GLX30_00010 [Streptomyces sp. Tu 2975]
MSANQSPRPANSTVSTLLIALVVTLFVVVLVALCAAGAYLVWQHPTALGPLTAALAVLGGLVTAVMIVVGVLGLRSR